MTRCSTWTATFCASSRPRLRSPAQDRIDVILSAGDGDKVSPEALIRWSPTQLHALVIHAERPNVRIYDADSHQVRPAINDRGQVLIEAEWTEWPYGTSEPYRSVLKTDVYWSDDQMVALTIRVGNDWVVAGLIVDLESGIGIPLLHGHLGGWPGRPTGSWKSGGDALALSLRRWSYEHGVKAGEHALFESVVVGRDGKLLLAAITAKRHWYDWPRQRPEWSPDGSWLAIGGH